MPNLPEEHWRPIPEWEGLYEVSSRGRVRSLERHVRQRHGNVQVYPATDRKLSWNGRYFHVSLTDRQRRKVQLVHQAVAGAFIGPRKPGMHTNHIDGDPTNNQVDNLEYVTPQANRQHAVDHGFILPLRGEKHGSHKLDAHSVITIRRLYGRVPTGKLARRYGVSASTVCDIAKRRSWRHLP